MPLFGKLTTRIWGVFITSVSPFIQKRRRKAYNDFEKSRQKNIPYHKIADSEKAKRSHMRLPVRSSVDITPPISRYVER